MVDQIPQNEQDLIINYIQTFGPLNDSYSSHDLAPLTTILKEWSKCKKALYQMLGEQLIVKRPYTYAIPEENLAREIENKRDELEFRNFYKWLSREIMAPSIYTNSELYHLAEDAISARTLAENRYLGETKTINLSPDDEPFKVSKGMRPMKILSKLAQKYECDLKTFEDFRIWHSQILNTKYMDGELCLSIHPLDYMTMSDNDNNWDSCMNWSRPGDYRCGTIECMNSPYIIVAYLHNPNHQFSWNKDNSWNSKRWRELFLVNQHIISEIKGYCFQDEHLTNTCLMWIKELAQKNLGFEYDNDEINVGDVIPFGDNRDLMIRLYPENYMYNDIGTLDKHRARINRRKIMERHNLTEWAVPPSEMIHYMSEYSFGGEATCMCCGQPIESKDRDNAVFCQKCDGGTYCVYCGEYISNDKQFFIEDLNGPICESCFEYECMCDDLTDDVHLSTNITPLYLMINSEFTDGYIAVYKPEDNIEYQKLFKCVPHKMKQNYQIKYYCTLDDAYEPNKVLELFSVDPSDLG